MKKIAHVLVLPKMAGAQKFCHMLLSEIKGYDKYVLVSSSENVDRHQVDEFTLAFNSIGVKIIWCEHLKRNIGRHDIKGFCELYKIFKAERFDIVHTNSTKPGIIGRVAARLAGIKKIVHTVHGTAFYKGQAISKRFIFWAIEAVALQFGNVNVCVNRYYLKYYKPFFWKKNIHIYNGYKFEVLEEYNKRKVDNAIINKKKFSFLFVGRLDNPKNPEMLIQAFSSLKEKRDDIHLDIVGDGELRNTCERLVYSLKLNDNVSFHGWVEKPYEFFSNCDAFVCPSRYEAFGFMFLEAAFFKKPIVATNVEGIPEVVIDRKMGFLVNSNDHIAFAGKMVELIDSTDLANEMGIFGHRYVVENFNVENFVQHYQKIYDEG